MVLDEAFLDMPEYALHPQSLLMETTWVCSWCVRARWAASRARWGAHASRSRLWGQVCAYSAKGERDEGRGGRSGAGWGERGRGRVARSLCAPRSSSRTARRSALCFTLRTGICWSL